MKKITYVILATIACLAACSHHKATSSQEVKASFGDFGDKTLKYFPIDYTKAPIYQKISHDKAHYEYLDKVDIYSIGHLSDSLFVTGFMVVPKAAGKYPCIVFNRGGNQEVGRLLVATAVEVMAPLAAEGYVVIASNYRGNSGSEGKEEFGGKEVNDVLNLIKSLAEYEKADTSRVGLLGLSRGGMMNFLALRQSTKTIKCIANIGGITDLAQTITHHTELEEVCKELIPNYNQQKNAELQKRSAVLWCKQLPKNTPILLLHSLNDEHVYYGQIPTFADSLSKYQLPYQLFAFENDNHGIVQHEAEVRKTLANWFDKYLTQGKTFDERVQRQQIP